MIPWIVATLLLVVGALLAIGTRLRKERRASGDLGWTLTRAEAALRTFGQHQNWCASVSHDPEGMDDRRCNCGLREILYDLASTIQDYRLRASHA